MLKYVAASLVYGVHVLALLSAFFIPLFISNKVLLRGILVLMFLALITRILLQDCPFTIYERSLSNTHLVKWVLKTFNIPKNRLVVLWLPNTVLSLLIILVLWRLYN